MNKWEAIFVGWAVLILTAAMIYAGSIIYMIVWDWIHERKRD